MWDERPKFDEKDREIQVRTQAGRDHLNTLTSLPREGDVLVYPDGMKRRVAYAWHDALQPTVTHNGDQSYYVGESGNMSFSGSLASSVPNEHFSLLPDLVEVPVWFFHHGHSGAHRGVHCTIKVRSWQYTP